MSVAAAALLAGAAMAMPPGAGAGAGGGATVDIPGRLFAPSAITVLAGQAVTWRNDDLVAHTVTGDAGSFDSGRLAPGASFTQAFDHPGTYTYVCTIHHQMRGTIDVAALGLTAPDTPVAAGSMAMLDVLAPAGTPSVTLERLTAAGAEPVATQVPGADGRAAFRLTVAGPGRYRARAGDLTSPVARVRAAPRVTLTARRSGRRISVRATITPALPGATVELQRYVRERFDYLPVRRVRSKAGAAVTFRYATRGRVALRSAVVKAPGGWSPGRSPHVLVRAVGRR